MASDEVDNKTQTSFVRRVLDTFHTIPCTRTAYLHGMSSGLIVGVSTFLFTSRALRASNMGVATFALVMPGSFFYCRYQNFKRELETKRAKSAAYVPWRPEESSKDNKKET